MSQQENFKQSLFGCFDDLGIACLACYCPCISAGKIAEKTGNSFWGCCLLTFYIPPVGAVLVRFMVRKAKNIEDHLLEDLLMGLCCECCSFAQCHLEVNEGGDQIRR
uniref:Protein PLANT CADMIUM RESISTANCE 7 (Trinotate prediction) n=1 Tax=Henneguya salminicola TaxID=69463 RepID=A0A6G3MMR8_HENSL